MRLLSVSTVTRLGYQVIFDHSSCQIWKDNINILSASPHGNLFSVNRQYGRISQSALTGRTSTESRESSDKRKSKTNNTVSVNSPTKQQGHNIRLGHQRLGHLNIADVRRLAGSASGLMNNQTPLPSSL